ncbi:MULTISPECIES: hypothetical protein [unclassified Streptomyces]|uniref:hypothetical protein n=1 Tax=unclassified Streptomyces TaxID=2593676 RepID=UPI0013714193|nr:MULTISPECIES: hypothetical protein [unclassified Streptomyces]MYZ35363.1 hypothetical protein [Streptomyces sp. SID4917]
MPRPYAGHTVRDDGRVEPGQAVDLKHHNDPDHHDIQRQANAGLGGFRARIEAATAEATEASCEASEILRQIDPFGPDKRYGGANAQEDAAWVAALAGISKRDIPDGTDPQRAAAWWNRLDEGEQHIYLAAFPDRLGTGSARSTACRRPHATRPTAPYRTCASTTTRCVRAASDTTTGPVTAH